VCHPERQPDREAGQKEGALRFRSQVALFSILGCLALVWIITTMVPFRKLDLGELGTFIGPAKVIVASFNEEQRLSNDVSGRNFALLAWILFTGCVAVAVRFIDPNRLASARCSGAALISKIKGLLKKRGHRVFLWLSILSIAAITVRSFILTPAVNTSPVVVACHLEGILGLADRMSFGEKILKVSIPDYGVLSCTFLCGVERALGLLSIGGVLHFLETLNLVWLLTITFLLWKVSRGRWFPFIVGILLFAPWYAPIFGLLIPPNHSGFRILPIAVMLLTLFALERLPGSWRALTLGGMSMLGIAWNFESGIAAMGGACAYLIFINTGKQVRLKEACIAVGNYLAGAIAGVFLASFLASLMGGMWISPASIFSPSEHLRVVLSGSAGGVPTPPLYICLLVATLMGQATATIVRLAFCRRDSHRSAVQVAIATMLLAWVYYSMSRAAIEYFAAPISLYVLLFAGELRAMLAGRTRSALQTIALLTVMTVWLFYFYSKWVPGQGALSAFLHVPRWEAPLLDQSNGLAIRSGVAIPPRLADFLDERSKKIRSVMVAEGRRPVYFSPVGYWISRTSGVVSAQFQSDPAVFATKNSFDQLMTQTLALDHEFIYIDSALQPGVAWYADFYRYVRQEIGNSYTYDHTDAGWEVWRRKK